METSDLIFALLSCSLVLIPTSLSISLFLTFQIEIFILCLSQHGVLETCNSFFGILERLKAEFAFSLGGDFGLELFSNSGIMNTFETFVDGMNAFCIVRWT
jgi:hypothetical protein